LLKEDPLLLLLNRQLQGVSSSLLVCKWPIMLTSCFFVTLLAWDVAGDQGGWFKALWVPIAGVAMALLLWVWDQILTSKSGIHVLEWSQSFLSLTLPTTPPTHPALELVHSSLHQPPLPPSPDSSASQEVLDEEFAS
jgi:hypothetical protein